MGDYGFDWATRTGGRLTAADKRGFMPAVMAAQARFARDRLAYALGTRGQSEAVWVDEPDSAFVARAREAARDLQSPDVLAHAERARIFGHALAARDGVTLDPELFAVSSLLHDAGIEHPAAGQCFTLRSALAADEVAAALRIPKDRRDAVTDAIVEHISPGVSPKTDPLGHYLQAGATADLAGLRLRELPQAFVDRAYAAFPLGDLRSGIVACWNAESDTFPEGRAAFVRRWARFVDALKLAPRHA